MVEVSDRVAFELMRLLRRNYLRALAPTAFATMLCSMILAGSADRRVVLIWISLAITVAFIRLAGLHFLVIDERLKPSTKLRCAMGLSFLAGCSYGIVLLFFPSMDPFSRATLTATFAGLTAGAIMTTCGYRPILLSFLTPVQGGLLIAWLVNPGDVVTPATSLVMAACSVAIVMMCVTIAQETFDSFSSSIAANETQEVLSAKLTTALQTSASARKEAERLSASKTRFLASASHDLRQPVHVLNLYSAVLARREHEPEAQEILTRMAEAIESLSSELDTLLDLSKIDSNAIKPTYEIVDVQALSGRLLSEFSNTASSKGLTILDRINRPFYTRTDVAMLSQVLRNLIGNAIKYSDQGEISILVEPSQDKSSLTLVVADTGVGIPEEHLEHIFDEFYQVDNPHRDKRFGQGLGLSIVCRLVKTMEHSITVRSVLGQGTQFRIEMPRCDFVESTQTAHVGDPAQHVRLPAGLSLHVVDDDQSVRHSMQTFLQDHGMTVTVSANRQDAIDAVTQSRPSLMLVDLSLGTNESGADLLRDIRRFCPDLPAVFITGEATLGEIQHPDDVQILQKPVNEQELLIAIKALARQSASNIDSLQPARGVVRLEYQ